MNRDQLEGVWLAGEAIEASSECREQGIDTPPVVVEQLKSNFEYVAEVAEEILPRLGELTDPDLTKYYLYDALLSSERGEGAGRMCLRVFDLLESNGVEMSEKNQDIRREFEEEQTADEQTEQLFTRINSQDFEERQRAREELVQKYRRFINMLAWKVISSTPEAPGVSREDLAQEGMIALLQSADNYDYLSGVKFQHYCQGYITGRMYQHYLNNCSTVRLGDRMRKKLRIAAIEDSALPGPNGTSPNYDVLAKALGVSPDLDPSLYSNIGDTLGNIFAARSVGDEMVSTAELFDDREFDDSSGYVRLDSPLVVNVTMKSPPESADEEALRCLTKQALLEALDIIGGIGAKVIKLRFGLEDDMELTLEEVGSELGGLGREGVRKIQLKTLDSLRQGAKLSGLIGLLD